VFKLAKFLRQNLRWQRQWYQALIWCLALEFLFWYPSERQSLTNVLALAATRCLFIGEVQCENVCKDEKVLHLGQCYVGLNLLLLSHLGRCDTSRSDHICVTLPRWPRQVQSLVAVAGIIATNVANVNEPNWYASLYSSLMTIANFLILCHDYVILACLGNLWWCNTDRTVLFY